MRAGLMGLALAGPAAAAKVDWPGLTWLLGRWQGVGGGAQQGAGEFSFAEEAGREVIVRRNVAEYPAQNGRPAERHDDFMVIFRDEYRIRAIYWDSEGQTIRYDVSFPEPGAVRFLSEEGPGPRFRLTYHDLGDRTLSGSFEIAPPDHHDQFRPYLTWTAKRAP